MGALTLSGVLKRPVSGDVVPNARIIFDAIATGTVVLKGVSSSCKTAADGSYTVDLEYGDYAIQVSWAGQTQQYGTVHIDDTTPIGTLNDLLLQQVVESELTPEIVLEFRQLQQEMQEDLAQMEELNGEASGSASAAADSAARSQHYADSISGDTEAAAASAAAAATSETHSAASETAAAGSATAAEASEISSAASEAAAAYSASAAATSETHSAVSEDAAAASATAARTSETHSAASEEAAAESAAAAKMSESSSAASETAAATSEINASNARDAAEEYAQEAKEAASNVTSPLTDQGVWAIQSGYPTTPGVASIWQITDGGADPVNSEIIWDPGDMLVFLASSGTWCRLLGQQTVAGEPVALKFDADIILNVGAGFQIITSGTNATDVARLDADNILVVGDSKLPGVALKASDATNMYVLVPDGNGGYTKSRIYTESFPPSSPVTSVNQKNGDVELNAGDVGALSSTANLSEIAASGEEAQSAARQHLGCPYEIDDLYITRSKTDPNTRWPGTGWAYLGEGLTLRTAKTDGSDLGTMAGADDVALTTAQIPSHTHAIGGNTGSSAAADITSSAFDYGTKTSSSDGNHTHIIYSYDPGGSNSSVAAAQSDNHPVTNNTTSAGTHTHTTIIGEHSHTVSVPSHSHPLPSSTDTAGDGSQISVLQKSVMVAVWVRTV